MDLTHRLASEALEGIRGPLAFNPFAFRPIYLSANVMRNTFIPLTSIAVAAYLLWAFHALPMPFQARVGGSSMVILVFGCFSKVLYFRENHLDVEPLIGFIFLGLLRKRILYHDLLRVRFHLQPRPFNLFFDRIDLVTIFGSIPLYRFQGRRFWSLQREFLRRMPDKVGWRPQPPEHIRDLYDL
ncbi:MAG TPA: hypothetical protein DEW46_07620 [Verrucomicrobia bacterium]|nr:hypothetical protein [Verrucomicrobiota bacterium]